jgi:hypothetical protein
MASFAMKLRIQAAYCDMPPNWPWVSQDSGLFQGTLETGCPFASTSWAPDVPELEQPA